MLLISIFIIAIGFLLVYVFKGNELSFFANNQFVLNGTFFGHVFEFVSGAGLALIFRIKNKFASQGIVTYLSILLLFIEIWLISLLRIYYNTSVTVEGSLVILLNNFLLPLPICGVIYGITHENTFVSRFLSSNIMDLLGKSSYVFYLIHIGLIQSEIQIRVRLPEPFRYFAILVILIFISVFIYKYIE